MQQNPRECDPNIIASRLESINFAAIHTTTTAATSALLDIFSTSPEKGYVEDIREEITRVLKEEEGVWNKAGVDRMYKLESVVKESLRLRGGGARAVSSLSRKVSGPHLSHS